MIARLADPVHVPDAGAADVADDIDVAAYEPGEYDLRKDGDVKQDPAALLNVCPVCTAPVGAWCGGIGDIHDERDQAN